LDEKRKVCVREGKGEPHRAGRGLKRNGPVGSRKEFEQAKVCKVTTTRRLEPPWLLVVCTCRRKSTKGHTKKNLRLYPLSAFRTQWTRFGNPKIWGGPLPGGSDSRMRVAKIETPKASSLERCVGRSGEHDKEKKSKLLTNTRLRTNLVQKKRIRGNLLARRKPAIIEQKEKR